MCGILGIVGENAGATSGVSFQSALDGMQHRGPDNGDIWCDTYSRLGHRRLSIIDLTPSGHQPMIDSVSGHVIVYNGEIYNYLELKTDLQIRGHKFRTTSDTEVLLKCYLEWGVDCLKRLNGMWSLAIWSPIEKTLFFARDRFGIKPFYYTHQARLGFAFASEPKALTALFPECRQADEGSLYEFLSMGMLYASGRSFYKGIKVLPPAHCGEFRPCTGSLRIWRYWRYPQYAGAHQSVEDDVAEFKALLNSAVNIRLRSDVPVGVTLSGGPDSTAILAGAHGSGVGHITCFTSVYGDTNRGEAKWARRACSLYTDDLQEIETPKKDWLFTLEKIAWHMDGPGYSPAVYPLWYIMKRARQEGILVLLEGQGADEALGGYPQYGVLSLLSKLSATFSGRNQKRGWRDCRETWQRLVETFTLKWVLLWTIRELAPWLVNFNRRVVGAGSTLRKQFIAYMHKDKLKEHEPYRHPDRITRRLQSDHSRDILPGLLHYGDAISMAHSVESRLPFMDYRLIDFLFARSYKIKIRQGVTKWILREYLRGVNQSAIAGRKDKLGYPTPVESWLAEHNGTIARDVLLSSNAAITRYCEPRKIENLIARHVSGRHGVGNHIYRLLSTELWMQQCVVNCP